MGAVPRAPGGGGGARASVTGGTKVLSDRILVKVTVQPGESFLDKMIALVEGPRAIKHPTKSP